MPTTGFHLNAGIPEVLTILLVIGASVAFHAVVQNRVKSEDLRRQNDVAGYLFSAVGVIFAVILGFVVIVVWQKYDATVANVDAERSAVSDLYRTVGGFSEPDRSAIRSGLAAYVGSVIRDEWPQMSQYTNVAAPPLLEDVARRVDTFVPHNAGQADAHQAAIVQVVQLFDARRQRLIQSAPSVPIVLWVALVAGALSMLSFAYLFGVENHPAQLFMTAILAGLIAIFFIVIYEFDHPFAGSVSISDDGWVLLQRHLPQIP
jgi:hypothetical protein